MSAILSLEPNQSYAGMLGLLVQFCTSHKEMGVVGQHKASGRRLGREQGGCVFPQWFQPLASSEGGWFSLPRPRPFAVMCEEWERFLSGSGWRWALLQLLGR